MSRQRRIPGLPVAIRRRKEDLETVLRHLADTHFAPVIATREVTADGVLRVFMTYSGRISKVRLRLHIFEDFRDLDTDPLLYAFSYVISPEADVQRDHPLFRYECHPDVSEDVQDMPSTHSPLTDGRLSNVYEERPHFHPDNTSPHPLPRLHYLFQSEDRWDIVFDILRWLEADLIHRFVTSRRLSAMDLENLQCGII